MELLEAIEKRHSVRSYTEQEIADPTKSTLQAYIDNCNQESGLHCRLILNEPQAFACRLARYGKFSGVRNYIAMIGPNTADLAEKCGYYGEKIVLKAQQLGLNTCWVGLTYSKIKSVLQIAPGDKLCLVIAIGYGATQGVAHKVKQPQQVAQAAQPAPDWFQKGVKAALLAPTAVNQQKFMFTLNGNQVTAKAGLGFYSKVDLGIVKLHFEIGAGPENFTWA